MLLVAQLVEYRHKTPTALSQTFLFWRLWFEVPSTFILKTKTTSYRFPPIFSVNWYWIDINHACFAVLVTDDNVVEKAPPIAKWMIGRQLDEVRSWVTKKQGSIQCLSS